MGGIIIPLLFAPAKCKTSFGVWLFIANSTMGSPKGSLHTKRYLLSVSLFFEHFGDRRMTRSLVIESLRLKYGESGIRTHGTLASTPHFECGAFNRTQPSLLYFFSFLIFLKKFCIRSLVSVSLMPSITSME